MRALNCPEARDRLWGFIDGDVKGPERAALEAHLAECEACRRELALRRGVWALLELDAVPAAPDLSHRVLRRAAREERHRRHLARLRWAALAAACLVLALTLTVSLLPHDTSLPPETHTPYLETQLVSLDQVTDIELLYYADTVESLTSYEEGFSLEQ